MEQTGKKISELEHLSSLSGGEMIPIVHDGRNYKTSVNDFKELFGSGSKLAVEIPIGNTSLGDSLLEISDDNELVVNGHLDKSEKKLHVGTPYDLIFGALLYAPEVIYQPTDVKKRDASISFTNGSIAITNLSVTSSNVGTPITFNVSVTKNGEINTTSAKVYDMEYGYFETNSPTDWKSGTSVEKTFVTSGAGYSAVSNIQVSVKLNNTPITCTKSGDTYSFTPTEAGTYTISATATDRTHSGGSIQGITVYPSDSSHRNISSKYTSGVTATGKTASSLGGELLTATSKTVTVVVPPYVVYQGEYIAIDYDKTPDSTANLDGTVKNYTVWLEVAASANKPLDVLVPKQYSSTNIVSKFWDSAAGWKDAFPVWEGPVDEEYNGTVYSKYTSKTRTAMTAAQYFITIKTK